MPIDLDYVTYEVFDSGCYVFRYYNQKTGLVLYKNQYLFYTIEESKKLFLTELNTIFL
jgi:hypothetical protein